MNKFIGALALLIVVSACAKKPENIAAIDIGSNPYAGQSCKSLQKAELGLVQALDSLSAQQNNAVAGDAFGVFLLGIPMSSLTGNDRETEIAVNKGKNQKLEQEKAKSGCTYVIKPSTPEAAEKKDA